MVTCSYILQCEVHLSITTLIDCPHVTLPCVEPLGKVKKKNVTRCFGHRFLIKKTDLYLKLTIWLVEPDLVLYNQWWNSRWLREAEYKALPKWLGEFLDAHWLVAVLELVEDPLQCKGDTLGGVIALCGHHVYCLEGTQQKMGLG